MVFLKDTFIVHVVVIQENSMFVIYITNEICFCFKKVVDAKRDY